MCSARVKNEMLVLLQNLEERPLHRGLMNPGNLVSVVRVITDRLIVCRTACPQPHVIQSR